MCIVIDINALSAVFSPECIEHPQFVFVLTWINTGRGFVVFGGSKYKKELSKTRYLKLIRQLKDAGQAIGITDSVVDALEAEIKSKTVGTDCNDHHIIALLGASRCPILCSLDASSFPHVKNRSLYPNPKPKVKIYSSKKNKDLLIKTSLSALSNIT